jgi:hypothetical protein
MQIDLGSVSYYEVFAVFTQSNGIDLLGELAHLSVVLVYQFLFGFQVSRELGIRLRWNEKALRFVKLTY